VNHRLRHSRARTTGRKHRGRGPSPRRTRSDRRVDARPQAGHRTRSADGGPTCRTQRACSVSSKNGDYDGRSRPRPPGFRPSSASATTHREAAGGESATAGFAGSERQEGVRPDIDSWRPTVGSAPAPDVDRLQLTGQRAQPRRRLNARHRSAARPRQGSRRPSSAPGGVVSAAVLPNTDPGGPSRPCSARVAR
jgi:hypothetical protein